MQISIAECDIVGIMETKNPGTPFAERLRQLRQDEGKTQDDVLEYLRQHGVNLKQSALSHYETGRTEPPLLVTALLAQLFDVSADYLLGTTDNSQSVAELEEELAQKRNDGDLAKAVERLSRARRQQALDYIGYLLTLEQDAILLQNQRGWAAALRVLERRLGVEAVRSALADAAAEHPFFGAALAAEFEQDRLKKSK